MKISSVLLFFALSASLPLATPNAAAAPVVLHPSLKLRALFSTGTGATPIRLARDPRNNQLYYLKLDGGIYRVNILPDENTSTGTLVHDASQHGISNAAGMVIGSDGTLYLVGNSNTNSNNETFATITRGIPNPDGSRNWSILATTQPYARSRTAFDHVCNGIMLSPDESYLLLNSGSRTDHGEVQSLNGLYPNTREVGLTSCILKIPLNSTNLILRNDREWLREHGHLFAEGIRNTYDMAYAPNGDFFGTENGPDRDMSEELNWLRPGRHYGFPWRIGGQDNPQQFADYTPSADKLLDGRFTAVRGGYYRNDPTFPPTPTVFAEPVVNLGPDADSYRDPVTGEILDASDRRETLSTFTAHRSPLGILFDLKGILALEFRHHCFVASWTTGDATGNGVAGPFRDPGQDLLHVVLEPAADNSNYTAKCFRLVGGFSNPIDTEWIDHRMYVIEYSGLRIIWEVEFPRENPGTLTLESIPERRFRLQGSLGTRYRVEISSDLKLWSVLIVLPPEPGAISFTDPTPVAGARYYRAVPQ